MKLNLYFPKIFIALAVISLSMAYGTEDAWSEETLDECVQDAPTSIDGTDHSQRIGYDTFKRSRSSGNKLIIRCVDDQSDTTTSVTYRNFYEGTYSPGDYPVRNQGGTPTTYDASAIQSDGAIGFILRRGSGYWDYSRLRWAVEREGGAGSMPKPYVQKACTADSEKMCYVEATDADLAGKNLRELSDNFVYWRLMRIVPKTDGNRKSNIAEQPLVETADEARVEDNQDNFIQGSYIYLNPGSQSDSFSYVYDSGNGNRFIGDSVLLNPNGLVNFELVLEDLRGEKAVKVANANGAHWSERDKVVEVNPGGPFNSVTVRVVNSEIVAGQQGVTSTFRDGNSKGGHGIFISNAETGWNGAVTVDLSGTSKIEAWASKADGAFVRGIRIGMSGNKMATVRLGGTSTIDIKNAHASTSPTLPAHIADEPESPTGNDRVEGQVRTTGDNSPGIVIGYPRGVGSVRVNTPLSIYTVGADSPGISARFSSVSDPLLARTSTDSWRGINFNGATWWTYAGGDTTKARLWDGNMYMASTGLTLEQVELFFRYGMTKGGCLDDGATPAASDCTVGDSDYVAELPTQSQVNYGDYRTRLLNAGVAADDIFDSPDDGVAAGAGPMARMQVDNPLAFANRIAIADALKAIRDSMGGTGQWNTFRQNYNFRDNHGITVGHGGSQAGAGIVYEIGARTGVYTGAHNSPAISAYVSPPGSASDVQTQIRIGDGSDFDGVPVRGEARFIVDQPITTTATSGKGSHGVVIIATASDADDIADMNHPLAGRDWLAGSTRNVVIDIESDVMVNGANNYGIALMGAKGTTSTVRVAPAGTVGQQNDVGGSMLFWKAADTVINFGTTKGKIDFHEGNDRLVLRGGTVTGVTTGATPDMLDFGPGEDRLELRSGTIDIGILNLETMVKSGSGDARIGAVTFDGTASTLMVSDSGSLIVTGHVNLGTTGTVRVAATAKLVMEATGVAANPARIAKITAKSITFEGKSRSDVLVSFLATVDSTRGADITAARGGWLGDGTKVIAGVADIPTDDIAPGNFETEEEPIDTRNPLAIVVERGETIDIPLSYDAGNQQVEVRGVVNNNFSSGSGDDTLTVPGTIGGDVNMGTDDDTLTVPGTIGGDVNMGTDDDTLTVPGTIGGDVNMGTDDDTLTVPGTIDGDVDMGAGDDTLTVDGTIGGNVDMSDPDPLITNAQRNAERNIITLQSGEIVGSVMYVSEMFKRGSGIATLRGEVTFSSSKLMVEEGKLYIESLVNLGSGSEDVVTVEAGGQIVIVATGAASSTSHGRIIAGTVILNGDNPQNQIQILATRAATRDADWAAGQDKWINSGALITDKKGSPVSRGNFQEVSEDERPPGGGGGAASSDSDSNAFYAAGALAVLWLVLRDDFCCELVDYESGSAGATFTGVKGAGQYRSGGVQTWAKMYSDSEVSAMQGLAVGMDARIGEHGYFGVSAMPSSTGSADTTGLSLNRRTSFEGGRYEGRGGWQKDSLFAGVRLSYGDYRASTSFKNVFEAGGQMSGSFDLVHTHLELGAGMQLNAGEQATVTPSLGIYGGSLSQGGSSASNAALVADVPGYRQTYQGWRAGVQLKASGWLSWSDEIKARPQVGLSMYRTRTSGPGKLAMNQRDRLGVLNFKNALPVRGLPQNINAFKAGVSLKKQGGLNMNLNYVGYEADGKFYHGAVARVSIGF